MNGFPVPRRSVDDGCTVRVGVGTPISGTPAHIQSMTGPGVSLAFASNVTKDSLLVVQVQSIGTVSPISVTDTLGTTYSLAVAITGQANNAAIYYGVAPASGANTVTGTHTNDYARTGLMEFSGRLAGLHSTASLYGQVANPSVNLVVTNPACLIVGAIAGYRNTPVYTAGAGMTLTSQSNGADANALEYALVHEPQAGNVPVGFGVTSLYDNSPLLAVAFSFDPSQSVGRDGDLWLDAPGKKLYGPRIKGYYPLLGSLT